MSQEPHEALPPVLIASAHDVRYFASLLRGVSFSNRATVTVTERGLTITVEDARTLLGTAFIFSGVFDEYTYTPEPPKPRAARPQRAPKPKPKPKAQKRRPNPEDSSETESDTEPEDNDAYDPAAESNEEDPDAGSDGGDNAAFEIPLNTLIDCLNIFGTAGPASGNISASLGNNAGRGMGRGQGGGRGRGGGWPREGDRDEEGGEGRGNGQDALFGGGSEGKTGMRLSYAGAGYPLTLIIAEDASGPTTTCEITTFEPEPHLELDFDNSKIVLKIILKSSWLRDALSELDPSSEKLTFIGNPPSGGQNPSARSNAKGKQRQTDRIATTKPMLRIQATGTFGSTEMDYPNDREVLETFECQETVQFSYRFGHILRTIKALNSSTKTSLRIDEDGLLSLQFLMPSAKPRSAGGTDAFIEFRCLPLDEGV